MLLSAIYNKIWLFGGHSQDTNIVEVFDLEKGISFDTSIKFNSTGNRLSHIQAPHIGSYGSIEEKDGMKYPSAVVVTLNDSKNP